MRSDAGWNSGRLLLLLEIHFKRSASVYRFRANFFGQVSSTRKRHHIIVLIAVFARPWCFFQIGLQISSYHDLNSLFFVTPPFSYFFSLLMPPFMYLIRMLNAPNLLFITLCLILSICFHFFFAYKTLHDFFVFTRPFSLHFLMRLEPSIFRRSVFHYRLCHILSRIITKYIRRGMLYIRVPLASTEAGEG